MQVHTDRVFNELCADLHRQSVQQLQFCSATCNRDAYGRARLINERIQKLTQIAKWVDENPKFPAWGKLLAFGFVADALQHVYSEEPLDKNPQFLTLAAFLKALVRS